MPADLFGTEMKRDALISECGRYRYWLSRIWDESRPVIAWLMLNPSTADASVDDPTIRRCVGFSRQWGAGGIIVVNLFALRATDPHELSTPDCVGELNDAEIVASVSNRRCIAAWGCHGSLYGRDREVVERVLGNRRLECLGMTKDGYPRHPLYVSKATNLQEFVIKPEARHARN